MAEAAAARPPRGVALSAPGLQIGAAAVATAFFAGSLAVAGTPIALGTVAGVCYAAVALLNLQVAIAIWVGLIWLEQLPAVGALLALGAGLMAASWLGGLRGRLGSVLGVIRRHRLLVGAIAVLLGWLTLSLAWADDPILAAKDLWHWYAAAGFFVVFATTISRPGHLKLVVWALVLGAAATVTVELLQGGLVLGGGGTGAGGRLEAGGSTPNVLAAGLVPAAVMTAALFAVTPGTVPRLLLVATLIMLTIGLGATQSRGGLLAAIVALFVALIRLKRRRVAVLLVAALAAGVLVTASSLGAPTGLDRVTTLERDRGTGRIELWRAGWETAKDAPLTGVGLNNFMAHSPRYVRELDSLRFSHFLTQRPTYVHNQPLQMLADTGIVGFGLFLAVILGSLAAAHRAAARFRAWNERSLAILAEATVVAMAAMLASLLFISHGHDRRLWLLLAMGPALLAVATRTSGGGALESSPE
jgi:O-antigen ligase